MSYYDIFQPVGFGGVGKTATVTGTATQDATKNAQTLSILDRLNSYVKTGELPETFRQKTTTTNLTIIGNESGGSTSIEVTVTVPTS